MIDFKGSILAAPGKILADKELSYRDMVVGIALSTMCIAGERRRYDGKTSTLAKALNMSQRSLQASITVLVKRGYFSRTNQSGRRCLTMPCGEVVDDYSDQGCDRNDHGGVIETIRGGGDRNDHPLNNSSTEVDLNTLSYTGTRARETYFDEIVFDQRRVVLQRLAAEQGLTLSEADWAIFQAMVESECSVLGPEKPQYGASRITGWAIDAQKKQFLTDMRQAKYLKAASEPLCASSRRDRVSAYSTDRAEQKTAQRAVEDMSEQEFTEWLAALPCGYEQKNRISQERAAKIQKAESRQLFEKYKHLNGSAK